ncbi:hypothetical protein Q7P37_000767 [Cladosporium fusiforme]
MSSKKNDLLPNASSHFEVVETDQEQHRPNVSLGQAIRRYPKITTYAFALTIGILLWGYDLVIVGTVSKEFGEQSEGRYFIPVAWLSAWAVSTNIGLMVGAVLFGWFQDRFGRRTSLIVTSLVCSLSVAVCYISDMPSDIDVKRGVFFLAKTIQGFSVGGIMVTIQTWLSEVVPTDLRGPLMALLPIFKLIGQLIGAGVSLAVVDMETKFAYRLCFATQWPFSGILTIGAFFLPESPVWLLRRKSGNTDAAAYKAMNRLYQHNASYNFEEVFAEMKRTLQMEADEASVRKESYLACWKGTNRRRTIIVVFAEFIPLLFGLQLLGSSSYFMQQNGMEPKTSLIFQVSGVACGVIACCITFYTLSKFGRRTLILISMAGITVLWGAVGFCGIRQESAGAMWFTAIGMLLVVVAAGIGAWPASYAVASEASSYSVRAKTQGIGWFVYGLGTMVFGLVMPYLYNPDAADLGSYTAFVYFVLSGAGLVGTFFLLPEMKGRSPEEIDKMFVARVPTRSFLHWTNTSAMSI